VIQDIQIQDIHRGGMMVEVTDRVRRVREAARKQRENGYRLEVVLDGDEWALIERVRGELARSGGGKPVTTARVVRVLLVRAEAAMGQGGVS
jgi:hypothetical protein